MAEVAQSSCIPHTTLSAGAPSAHKHSQFYCVKQSQLCCVDNHGQPRRGVSLCARSGPAGQALSPAS